MPQLIVNADDFGLTPLVNQAIVQAYRDGIVTSTTVMINLPDAPAGLELAQQEVPELALGLHLNLTNGSPVCAIDQIPSLVNTDGLFYCIEELGEVALQFDGDELYQELAAQIERFVELTGQLPSHMDAHYHIALMHPVALEATLALAHEYQLPLREVVPDLAPDQVIPLIQRFMPSLPTDMIEMMVSLADEVRTRNPVPHTPAQFISRFSMPTDTLGDLLNILTDISQAERPAEIMCHPGFANDPGTTIAEARQREFDVLCHPATHEVIERFGIELTNFNAFKDN